MSQAGTLNQSTPEPPAPYSTANLGVDYDSPTFRVTSQDQTPLSATNVAYVTLASNVNPGAFVTYPVTADVSFQDSNGTDDMGGNTFGTTGSTAWSFAMPMYIYAVANVFDTEVTFMLSRVPHRTFSPLNTNIAVAGNPIATTAGSFFAMDSTIDVDDFAVSSCRCIGCITMTKDATDGWEVQPLTVGDGIDQFHDSDFFMMPLNQNGATASGMSSSNGGDTIPTWSDTGIAYQVQTDGNCICAWTCNITQTTGAGTGRIRVHKPFAAAFTAAVGRGDPGVWSFFNATSLDYDTGIIRYEATNLLFVELLPCGSGVQFINSDYFNGVSGNRNIGSIEFYYVISKN